MKTKTITLYSFDELSESAQQKAIEGLYDLNTDNDWWEYTYEDAKRIGLEITSFDTDHYCKGGLDLSLSECCNKIIENHGPDCETHKTAQSYLKQWGVLVKKYSDAVNTDQVAEDNEYKFDQDADELESEFKKALLEDYRIILRKEYEYLTSREQIIESIKSNEYTFTEDGKLEN